jgi:hypothetical protein
MFSRSAIAGRFAVGRMLPLATVILISLSMTADPAKSSARDFSGWRGGIGIVSSTPSREIADVTEMGYELLWGESEDLRTVKALGISVFRYFAVFQSFPMKAPGYDFSQMADKDAAAKLTFDAWAERNYGVKGLSKYAKVRYDPKGDYGNVSCYMDLSSENELVKAVIATYMQKLDKDGISHGGIGLDNAGQVPQKFLEALTRRLNPRGLGIAANGCPDKYLHYIDVFGNEGFPFSINYARQARQKGLRGILGEFTMQHLSAGEMDAYLKSKLFNGIVFFGYTNGGTSPGARYSNYGWRPDVYNHQRWVLRKLVPISRAVQHAGPQKDPAAKLARAVARPGKGGAAPLDVIVDAQGKIVQTKRSFHGLDLITGRLTGTTPLLTRYGGNIADGIYLFVDSGSPEEVICDTRKLGIRADTLAFDEFSGRVFEARRSPTALTFKTREGPSVVQLGSAATVAKNILARAAEGLRLQLTQRELDRQLGISFPHKAWSLFCRGGKWDAAVGHSGKGSFAVLGSVYTAPTPQWKYFNRQGAAQLVTLNQTAAQPLVLRGFSKARDVATSEKVSIDTVAARRNHFDAREGHAYCMHLYLDYQDGKWPEVYTVPFSAGTHDWEEKSIRVMPGRPVKTAMVLLEFHQPQGAAWFDDLSLTSGDGNDRNLLAAPGFEEKDAVSLQAQAISADYEKQVQSLLASVEAAAKSATPAADIPALAKQVDTLSASLRDKGLAPCFPRELRDLDEAREKLGVCERLLAGRR